MNALIFRERCQFLLGTIHMDEFALLPFSFGMPNGLPSSLHSWHTGGEGRCGCAYIHLNRGSSCSVTLEKPNADVLQQVAAFPQEREEPGLPNQNWFWFYSFFFFFWYKGKVIYLEPEVKIGLITGKRIRDPETWNMSYGLTSGWAIGSELLSGCSQGA